jgi:glycosyltransferase involved in cell wall biosynthesis
VVVPVRDEEEHIAEQLGALAAQTYDGDWELVVADNGCRDRSMEIVAAHRHRLPSLTIAGARSRRGINHARNVGAERARGDLLAFCDADDVATPGWLAALARAAPGADLIAGALDFDTLNGTVERALYPWDPPRELAGRDEFLAYVPGGNCGVWADVARSVRWDESFRFGSSDIEFSWRAQLAGFSMAFAPGAVIQQRFKPSLRALAGQFFAYGRSDPQLYRRFRAAGMPRPEHAHAIYGWRTLARRAPDLLGPLELQAPWVRSAARRAGRAVGSVRHRALVL